MDEYALLTRRWVVDEPGFLEFEPGFGVEVVEFVWARHILLYITFYLMVEYREAEYRDHQFQDILIFI